MGFGDISQVMSFIWEKVCRNLRNWTDNEMVVTESLKLLLDISDGYESSLLLLKIESVQFVLQHHTVSFFFFLFSYFFSSNRKRSFIFYGIPRSVICEACIIKPSPI